MRRHYIQHSYGWQGLEYSFTRWFEWLKLEQEVARAVFFPLFLFFVWSISQSSDDLFMSCFFSPSVFLSLTWLSYDNVNNSSRCYPPVTTLWCSFSRHTKTTWFLTVKLANNRGISEWPTGRWQSSRGSLEIEEWSDVHYQTRVLFWALHMFTHTVNINTLHLI